MEPTTEITILRRLEAIFNQAYEKAKDWEGIVYLSPEDYYEYRNLIDSFSAFKTTSKVSADSNARPVRFVEHFAFGGRDFLMYKTLTRGESYVHIIDDGGYLIAKIDL